jgi:hypothetical protein
MKYNLFFNFFYKKLYSFIIIMFLGKISHLKLKKIKI